MEHDAAGLLIVTAHRIYGSADNYARLSCPLFGRVGRQADDAGRADRPVRSPWTKPGQRSALPPGTAAPRAVIKSSPHHWLSPPRPSRQAARPYVYASPALGVTARFCPPACGRRRTLCRDQRRFSRTLAGHGSRPDRRGSSSAPQSGQVHASRGFGSPTAGSGRVSSGREATDPGGRRRRVRRW